MVGSNWMIWLAALDNGHIGRLQVFKILDPDSGPEQVNLNALERVWEMADEMSIRDWLATGDWIQVTGGRGEDREAAWQRVIDFFLQGDDDADSNNDD